MRFEEQQQEVEEEVIDVGDLVVSVSGGKRLVIALGSDWDESQILVIDLNGEAMAHYADIEELRYENSYTLLAKAKNLVLRIENKERS
jgi:hypothetical protein